ncbi:MAG: 6-phosphogluconolactonase [Nitrospira sp.]|nr:6-phosphogluconolactonase [Nitrospira sp.]
MPVVPDIRIAGSIHEWAHDAAALIASASERAIRSHGRFTIALSGGSTPKTLYQALASPTWSRGLDWTRVYFLFGDERCVPPDHPDSNFGMVRASLFYPLTIQSDHISRISGEAEDPSAVAQQYEETIRQVTQAKPNTVPCIDLVLLGLGDDGHTASLFPGTLALQETTKLVTVGQAPTGIRSRLTMTLGVLNRAAMVLFLVMGKGKADMVRRVLEPGSETDRCLPAARVAPESGQLVWMLDQAAAEGLTRRVPPKGDA